MNSKLLTMPISSLYKKYPYLRDFFLSIALNTPEEDCEDNMSRWIEEQDYCTLDEMGVERDDLPEQFMMFISNMEERFKNHDHDINSITIVGGRDKDDLPEEMSLTLKKGDVVSVVGPTGAGKSRLLADIEWLAQGDTPTGRRILINGEVPPNRWRFSIEHKLVAQLSQNMNFVMDMSVEEFIAVHCESRLVKNPVEKTAQIIEAANRLAGEPLFYDSPITALSGGQSRALMIADTAFLSTSPIVLIDEIENAGINRKTAVDILIRAEKIVLIATHDPILALNADKRIVIQNGGIKNIINTSAKERKKLEELEELNDKLLCYRELLRSGQCIE